MASAAPPAPGLVARFWPLWVCRVLAGLDVGLYGALLVLACLCFHSWLRGEFWWSKLNVAGSFFYGEQAFQAGLGHVTLAGTALLLLIYSALGAVLAFITPPPPRWYRSLMVGLVGIFLFQLFADRWLWRHFHPFAAAYFPRIATIPANLLFGLSMIRLGRRSLALGRAEPSPAPSSDPAPADC